MDTHTAPSAEREAHGIPRSARLPGEPDPEALPPGGNAPASERLATSSNRPRAKRYRALLLGGGAVVGACVVAGGAFLLSPFNPVVPVPPQAAAAREVAKSAGADADQPLAPSAALAGIALPSRPSAVILPRYTPPPRDQALSELLAIRPGSAAAGAPDATTPAPAKPVKRAASAQTFVPHEPGAVIGPAPAAPLPAPPHSADADASPAQPRPAVEDITPTVLAAATATGRGAGPPATPIVEPAPPAAPSQGVAASAPAGAPRQKTTVAPATAAAEEQKAASAPAPPLVDEQKPAQVAGAPLGASADAVSQALRLQAGPMSDGEQAKVLELVTQIATMVRDLKSQNATLRADFARTTADDQARLADFARRIDLAEATHAVAAAKGAGELPAAASPAVATALAVRPAMAPASVAITRADVAVPAAAPREAKRYRVQAASPGLALLTEIARGGGDGAQIQVTVGDVIPGWGKVKSVAQRGTSWVVSTEHGVID